MIVFYFDRQQISWMTTRRVYGVWETKLHLYGVHVWKGIRHGKLELIQLPLHDIACCYCFCFQFACLLLGRPCILAAHATEKHQTMNCYRIFCFGPKNTFQPLQLFDGLVLCVWLKLELMRLFLLYDRSEFFELVEKIKCWQCSMFILLLFA